MKRIFRGEIKIEINLLNFRSTIFLHAAFIVDESLFVGEFSALLGVVRKLGHIIKLKWIFGMKLKKLKKLQKVKFNLISSIICDKSLVQTPSIT